MSVRPAKTQISLGAHLFDWFYHVAAQIQSAILVPDNQTMTCKLQSYSGLKEVFDEVYRYFPKVFESKHNKSIGFHVPVRPAKTQISLRIPSVSSESSPGAHWLAKGITVH